MSIKPKSSDPPKSPLKRGTSGAYLRKTTVSKIDRVYQLSIINYQLLMIDAQIPTLDSLPWIPYLTEAGLLAENWQRKIGVYAVFDQAQQLHYIGYSRDLEASLKQHLVRQGDRCYWLKVHIIERPSRTLLEAIRLAWLEEAGLKALNESLWTDPIDAKLTMTDAEKISYQNQDDLGKMKLLKTVARRLEEQIQSQLQERGVKLELRFNPKLKEQGLLDLK